ncbi:MAG: hypothetical protein NC122_10105 [Faecalibacterium sp.]|nr:hypothetical protein [Ruminococcus sp.]MCM1392834.1 hypothetical protein [Ruminococcus sp.]MCM1486543.1 hypothetical protein [Faecalibacterium sp.]
MKKIIGLFCALAVITTFFGCAASEEKADPNAVTIGIRCDCEDIYQVYYSTYIGDKSYGIGSVADLDHNKMTANRVYETKLTKEYFENGDVSKLVMDFSPYGKDDTHEQGTTNKVEINAEYGKSYVIVITGDKEQGFSAALEHSEVVD